MSKLFEPTQLKHLDLQNRVVMAPMTKKKQCIALDHTIAYNHN
ncbi:hypothetical protein [Vibrio vulnificus]